MMSHRKVFLPMTILVDEEGVVTPLSFRWLNGAIYEIDRILDKRPAASTKVGGCGMRYTVRIRGNERYLFEEDGWWFLEAPCYQ